MFKKRGAKNKESSMPGKQMVDDAASGSHSHFICHFPDKIGFLASSVLQFFFSRTGFDEKQLSVLEMLQKKGIIIYANKYKSNFDFLFYYTRYKKLLLPHPEIGFYYRILAWQPISRVLRVFFSNLIYFFQHFSLPDPFKSGYIQEELLSGKAGFLSLVDEKGFERRFVKAKTDPIRYLLEIQNTVNQPVFIIPQLIFYSNNPHRSDPSLVDILFGSKEKPGNFRRLFMLLQNPKKIFVEISDPVNLQSFLERPGIRELSIEQQAFTLRRQLVSQINRHRQSIIGPVLKTRVEIKENILTSSRFQQFISDYSEQDKVPISQAQKKASDYIEEIASNYSMKWLKILDFSLRLILKLLFEDMIIDKEGLRKIKTMSQKAPLVLVPCHKSHIDYLILSFIFYHNHMPPPLIVAGKNLSFWPLGSIFRGGGAFFMRRTFRGQALYKQVFSEYVYKILEEGFNIEIFIEGGRSRTGKLMMPKMGFISIILDAFKNKACDDILFVPISIGYDRVLEESAYIHEIEGGKKEAESLKQVIGARKTLKKRYGKVYVDFHTPLSLKNFIEQNRLDLNGITVEQKRWAHQNLGFRILNAINRVSMVTPYGIAASAILNCSKKRFTRDFLKTYIDTYMVHLYATGARLEEALRKNPDRAIDLVLNAFVQRKFIERASTGEKIKTPTAHTVFKLNEGKRGGLDYYKNNTIVFFVKGAFTALAILETDAFLFTASDLRPSYQFLQDFFSNEFAYDVDKTTEYFVRKILKSFIDDNMLTPHPTLPDTYNLTPGGLRKLKMFACFLKPFFEAYWIVLSFFIRYPKNTMDAKEEIKKIQALGNRMFKRKEIEQVEALSKITYKNAIEFYLSRGFADGDDNEVIETYGNRIQKYLTLLHN